MTAKKIYLIRHGETDFNRQQIVQGSGVDTSLNALGKLQAAAFIDAYKHIQFDKVYTSALKRSIQSVEKFIERGTPHQTISALNEINWGVQEGQKITPDEDRRYHELLRNWASGNCDDCMEGGESPNQMAERQLPFVELLRDTPHEQTILICMHGRAMRALLCQLLNYDLRFMDGFEHYNLCLYKLNFTGSLFHVKRFCDMRHLEGVKDC